MCSTVLSHRKKNTVGCHLGLRVSTVCTASPSAGKWSSPTTTGPRPPPSSDFTFTAVNHHKAVYFGGNQPGRGAVNDTYVIDFDTMVHMIRVHALAKCVDSSNSIGIGHIPMASGILQSYPSHCVHCSNYHSTKSTPGNINMLPWS